MKGEFIKFFSKKILELSEKIPWPKNKYLSSLKNIRADQKKFSAKEFETYNIPDKIEINLNKIILTITIDFNDFNEIIIAFSRIAHFDHVERFIKSFESNMNKLDGLSWGNILTIEKHGNYIPSIEVDESLPQNVQYVKISYNRILPSIIIIAFEFTLVAEVSKNINSLQHKKYLQEITFKKLPITSNRLSYTAKSGISICHDAIKYEMNSIKSDLIKWINDTFNFPENIMKSTSFIDAYKIKGNPINSDELNNWLIHNRRFLEGFGIISPYETSINFEKGILYSEVKAIRESKYFTDVVSKIDALENIEIDNYSNHFIISVSIRNLIEGYQNKLEKIRRVCTGQLYNSKKIILSDANAFQQLKKIIIILRRLKDEMKSNDNILCLFYQLAPSLELKDAFFKNKYNFRGSLVNYAKSKLNIIIDIATTIDSGATDYINVKNIFTNYKLQKTIYWLNWFIAILTVVMVVSSIASIFPHIYVNSMKYIFRAVHYAAKSLAR